VDLKTNQDYKQYKETVCSQIKNREVQNEVILELEHHVQDITAEYLEAGLAEKDAVAKAISRMGDAEVVGRELNKVHKPRPDWGIIALTLLMVGVGLFIAFFMDLDTSVLSPESMFSTKVIFSSLGIALAVGLYFLDYRKLQSYSLYLYVGTVLGLFISAYLSDWFHSYRLASNIVEISPVLLVLSLAGLFQHWKWEQPKYYLLGMGMLALPLILIMARPSLATTLVLAAVFIVLMRLSGAKLWQTLLPAGLVGLAIPMMIFNAPYLYYRFTAHLNPSADPFGHGWLSLQMENLRNSAGLIGQGGNTDPLLLPNLPGELVLNYIIYTFGWLAGIALILSVAAFLFRLAGVSLKVKNTYGKSLATGFATIFGVRFLWNILMNLGILPIAGISLPLISYGRVDFLMNMIMIGLILSIYRRKTLKSKVAAI